MTALAEHGARIAVRLGGESTPSALPFFLLATALTLASLGRWALGGQGAKGPGRGLKQRAQLLLWAALGPACSVLMGALSCFGACRERRRVLVLGLDNAGKTALCQVLSHCRGYGYNWPWKEPRPEHHVLHHHATWRGTALHLIDPCGTKPGGRRTRFFALWEELLQSRVDGVIFVVDAADSARHPQAQEALHWLLQHPALHSLPVLVLGTKIDMGPAVDTWDLECNLGLAGLTREQRSALLGRTLRSGGMPYELRRRIAGFHPNTAASPPHAGPLALRMCSLKRRGSVAAAAQWLVTNLPGDAAAASAAPVPWPCPCPCPELPLPAAAKVPSAARRQCFPGSVEAVRRLMCRSQALSLQAGSLPLYRA